MGRYWYKTGFGLFLLFFLSQAALAENREFTLPVQFDRINLTPYLSVYKDPSARIGIDEIPGIDSQGGFTPLQGDSGFGYSKSAFWFKLTITNPNDSPVSWFIEYPYPVADHVEFFLPSPAGFISFTGGDTHPFGLRPVHFRTPVVPMELPPGTHTFYFTIQSKGAIVAPLTGWSSEAFERHRRLDTAVNWLFFGLMLSTLIYSIFIFVSMKDTVFLWLGIFVVGVSLFTLAHTGMGMQYFWPDAVKWNNICHPLAGFTGVVGAALFSRLFLNTRYHSPLFDRLFGLLSAVSAGMMGLTFILPYHIITQVLVITIGLSVSIMVCCGVLIQYKGLRQARFYLLAWTPFALSALLMGLKSYGFLENNLLTDSTVQITASFVTCLFVFGLMDKVTILQLQREGALRRLHQSEKKYRMLANNVKDVIWILDLATYKITYITPSIKEMMGYSPGEAKQISFDRMLPPESFQKAMKAIQWRKERDGAVPGENPRQFTIELETCHKDQSIFWTETTTTFLKDASGNITEMIAVTRDISSRKQAEKEKKALEFQLNQSGKLEAMGTLAGGIAHDMNNILSAILGYTDLSMKAADKNSRMHYRLSRVAKASYRARDLVRQILTFSRQNHPDARSIKISLIVKEILALIRASLPATIEIVREIEDKDLAVKADPSQVHQIVMNLCSNAGYAMMEKGGTLTVSIGNKSLDKNEAKTFLDLEPGSYVSLSVRDTGQGMEKEVLDRIFDPFYTTKPVGEGTGMGLSMIHGIVKNLGGDIHVKSVPGLGTDFQVLLPMAVDPAQDKEQENRVEMPRGREKILYLDDEPDIVDMACDMLIDLGYEVTGKTDSREALEFIEADPHCLDLLVTDQTMPGMTGMDLADIARDLRPGLPVILSTGFSEKTPWSGTGETDPFPLLLKPYDQMALARLVRKVLDQGAA